MRGNSFERQRRPLNSVSKVCCAQLTTFTSLATKEKVDSRRSQECPFNHAMWATVNVSQIHHLHGFLTRDYIIKEFTKLQEGTLCPRLRVPQWGFYPRFHCIFHVTFELDFPLLVVTSLYNPDILYHPYITPYKTLNHRVDEDALRAAYFFFLSSMRRTLAYQAPFRV